jgi:hypothetical protein
MKKKFLFGLIALLSVSFIFFGCGDSGGGGGLGGNAADEAAKDLGANLVALLGGAGHEDDVVVTGANILLKDNLVLPVDLETEYEIPSGVTLTLDTGKTLTAKQDVAVNGAVVLTGATFDSDVVGTQVIIAADATVTDGTNFYTVTGTTGGNAASGTTYEWVTDAGGGTPGWKAQGEAPPAPSATVGTVTITGTAGVALSEPVNVTITIVNDKIGEAIAIEDNLKSWITNLPVGLDAVPQAAVAIDATTVIIAISGTPTETSDAALAITIPAAKLAGGQAITVTANSSAVFAITETWSSITSPVDTDADLYTSTLTVSAEESSLGNVRIVLGGTIPADVAYKAGDASYTAWTNAWSDPADIIEGFIPEPGNYGSFAFIGAFPANPDELDIVIKQTNDALRYNTGWTSRVSDTPLTAPVVKADEKSMYLGEIAYRWRTYDGTKVPATEDLSVLLWSEATDKTITLEIQSVDGTIPLKTITIDYNAVTFETDVASSYTPTASTGDYPNNLTVSSAIRDDVTGVTTITLSGSIADVVGGSNTWWNGIYGSSAPAGAAEGNYAAFIFDGAFPADVVTRRIAIKTENDALRLYTGSSIDVSNNQLIAPVKSPGPNIYIPEPGTAIKWRVYDVGDIPNGDWHTALLWSGAEPKVAKFEIQEFTPGYTPNPGVAPVEGEDYEVLDIIVIDYTNVTITATAE